MLHWLLPRLLECVGLEAESFRVKKGSINNNYIGMYTQKRIACMAVCACAAWVGVGDKGRMNS